MSWIISDIEAVQPDDTITYPSGTVKTDFWVRYNGYESTENQPPNTPSYSSPSDGATDVSRTPTLSWSCTDPDGDSLTYDVYLDTNESPSTIVSNAQAATSYTPGTPLGYETHYYWKIVASDGRRATTDGPIYDFTTESEPEGGGGATTSVNADLKIYYNSLTGTDYFECWCSRWDVDNYSVIVETMIDKTNLKTLMDNTVPGAVGELYKILGRPCFYDKTWEGNNTLKLVPNVDSFSNLKNMRRDTIIYPKNIVTNPVYGESGWINVKIEGYISGSNSQL